MQRFCSMSHQIRADMSTRLFTDMPMHSTALLMSQDRTASSTYFEEELRDLKRAASDQPDSIAKGCSNSEAFTQPAKYTRLWSTWTGPVYVLVNSRPYSSAEMFAAALQNNHAAKIIGTRTEGDGCGFMDNAPPVTLSNSQLRFRIPNCARLRAEEKRRSRWSLSGPSCS
jgi:hypothetical protein